MTFTILGSGTHFPNPAKRSAGYLLQDGKNLMIFDFGYGTLLRLVEMKVKYQDIKHIFFTHLHEDHYLDFLPFLNTLYLQVAHWGMKRRTLHLYGPRGFRKKLVEIIEAVGILYTPHIKLIFRELKQSRVRVGRVNVSAHPVYHMDSINALSYRIHGKNGDLANTGDLDYDEKIIPFLKGVRTLVIECGFPNRMKVKGHLLSREAGRIAQAVGAKKVILTHGYPPCDRVDIVKECAREYKGTITKAVDGMVIRL